MVWPGLHLYSVKHLCAGLAFYWILNNGWGTISAEGQSAQAAKTHGLAMSGAMYFVPGLSDNLRIKIVPPTQYGRTTSF